MWETAGTGEAAVFAGRPVPVNVMAFSSDGSRLLTADVEGSVSVRDLRTCQEVLYLEGLMSFARGTLTKMAEFATQLSSPEGMAEWFGSLDMMRWHLQQAAREPDSLVSRWQLVTNRGDEESVMAAAFSSAGGHTATVDSDDTLTIRDAETGAVVTRLTGCQGHRRDGCLAFSPDGRRLAALGSDQTAKVFDATSGACLLSLAGHVGAVTAVAFSPCGDRLVTGGADGAVKLWEGRTGKEVLSFEGDKGAALYLGFGKGGKRLVAAWSGGEVSVWEAETACSPESVTSS